MRRDDHALQLLFGDIGERKDRPVALMIGGTGAHLDTAADAVGAGRGRDLKGFALIGVDIGGGRQVERRVVTGNLYRLKSKGMGSKKQEQQEKRRSQRDCRQTFRKARRRVIVGHVSYFVPPELCLSARRENII
ncbi:hypothetical protein D3C80_511720 [compost metagenome]